MPFTSEQVQHGRYAAAGRYFGGESHVDQVPENLARTIEIGKRAANELFFHALGKGLGSETTPLRDLVDRANENPFTIDHNGNHTVRVKRYFEAQFYLTETLKEPHVIEGPWIAAGELAVRFHDLDQLLTLQRNLDQDKADEAYSLPPKQGHDLGASVMLLALHEEYARIRGIKKSEAWKICAAAAIMVLKHERVETYMEGLRADSVRAYDGQGQPIAFSALVEAYDKDRLDLFTLSPQQLISLLRYAKRDDLDHGILGFVTPSSPNGLHPVFEGYYAQQLAQLERNSRPLIEGFGYRDSQYFMKVAEAFINADLSDMRSAPTRLSIARSLLTAKSKTRKFWSQDDNDFRVELLKGIGKGAISLADKFPDDVTRKIAECLVDPNPGERSAFAKSSAVIDFRNENAYMSALALKEIGSAIMKSPPDYSVFDAAYAYRIYDLAQKAIDIARDRAEREGVAIEDKVGNIEARVPLGSIRKPGGGREREQFGAGYILRLYMNLSELEEGPLLSGGAGVAAEFNKIAYGILTEYEALKEILEDKPKAGRYTQAERESFGLFMDSVIATLGRKLKQKQKDRCQAHIDGDRYTSPFLKGSYDSLTTKKPTVLNEAA